ncbi:MAG: hypothetical protein QOG85_1823 [Gaiellaceae bacterium]|jgi:hypothetical protein|nr:hypothetical protein [Gaiellaceae bacterium]
MPASLESVSELRRDQLRALRTTTWWWVGMVLLPIVAGVAATVVVSNRSPGAVFVVAVVAVVATALVWLIGTYMLADSRAKSAFLVAWARSRGWNVGVGMWRESATPLLREGDRRHSEDHVSGPLPSAGEATLCHYTYEVRHTTTDSKGHTRTTWEEHPFTVIETGVLATGVPRLTLHPRSFGDNRLFDRIDSKLTSDRVVDLESSEFDHEFKLEVADSASDMAVRLVFEPAFIVWCLDQGDGMLFEIEEQTLVVAIRGHSYDAAELDGLVGKAGTIAARVADAGATIPKEA